VFGIFAARARGRKETLITSVRYKEMSTKSTKDTKKRSNHTSFMHCHFTKNANIQSLFRAFRVFRGQKLLMSNSGYYVVRLKIKLVLMPPKAKLLLMT